MSYTNWALGDKKDEQARKGHQSADNRPPEDSPNNPGVAPRGLVRPDWVHACSLQSRDQWGSNSSVDILGNFYIFWYQTESKIAFEKARNKGQHGSVPPTPPHPASVPARQQVSPRRDRYGRHVQGLESSLPKGHHSNYLTWSLLTFTTIL